MQPDLIFIAQEHKSIISESGIEGPPDIIIEVISPSNSFFDRNTKKRKYLEFGVKEYWIVDPGNKTLEIYIDKPSLNLSSNGKVSSDILIELDFDLSKII